MRRSELGPLLAYAISDAPSGAAPWSETFAAQLDGLPLLRLADEHQRHDSVLASGGGPEGIALLRTAPDSAGDLWLCHEPETRTTRACWAA